QLEAVPNWSKPLHPLSGLTFQIGRASGREGASIRGFPSLPIATVAFAQLPALPCFVNPFHPGPICAVRVWRVPFFFIAARMSLPSGPAASWGAAVGDQLEAVPNWSKPLHPLSGLTF